MAQQSSGELPPGGWRELMRLAWPLILANSFWTLQVTIDRMFLGQLSPEAMAAALGAIGFFWTPMALLQQTAAYATTFVAQYYGADRRRRVGPAVWQAVWFGVLSGAAFLVLIPLAPGLLGLAGHDEPIRSLEIDYFQSLCWSALPTTLVAALSSFFTGRGDSRTVILINAVGLAANVLLDWLLVFGNLGCPALGIVGAGYATAGATWLSAAVALGLFLRRVHEEEYATASGWRIDRELFGRLLYFGVPSGMQWALECLAFTVFLSLVGRIGGAALAGSSITFTLNMLAVLPALGIAQAVTVLVGQRLGENRPDLAERSTWSGLRIGWLYMAAVAASYVLLPGLYLELFRNEDNPALWNEVAAMVPGLLVCVAVYCLFDCMNLVFSFALKGAGDTRWVTAVALILPWPLMVLPTWLTYRLPGGVYWAWAWAATFIISQALVFLARFRGGKWRSMRVIETAAAEPMPADAVPEPVGEGA